MSYRFLILEDSITDRAQIKRAVRLSGLSAGVIQEASDVIEAIDLLTGHTADLVLASLDLPVASAAEMVGRLITEPSTRAVPVVIMSDDPNPLEIRRLLRRGARGYLRKPFTPDALREVASRILEPTHV
jgi:two-component system chemotaxis response regulator CheY